MIITKYSMSEYRLLETLAAAVDLYQSLISLTQYLIGRYHMVFCVKLNKEAEGLDRPPFPGELGEKIVSNISKEAWQQWLAQQTILINEYRLSPIDPQARHFLEEQLQDFLFNNP